MDAFRKSHFSSNGCQLPPCIIVRHPDYHDMQFCKEAETGCSSTHPAQYIETPELISKEQLPATKCQCEEATHLPHHFQVFSSSYSSTNVFIYTNIRTANRLRDHVNVCKCTIHVIHDTFVHMSATNQPHTLSWISFIKRRKGLKKPMWKTSQRDFVGQLVPQETNCAVWMRPLHT